MDRHRNYVVNTELIFEIRLSSPPDPEPVLYYDGRLVEDHEFPVAAGKMVAFIFNIPSDGPEARLRFADPPIAWITPEAPPGRVEVPTEQEKTLTIEANNTPGPRVDQPVSFNLLLDHGGLLKRLTIQKAGGTLRLDPTIIIKADDEP